MSLDEVIERDQSLGDIIHDIGRREVRQTLEKQLVCSHHAIKCEDCYSDTDGIVCLTLYCSDCDRTWSLNIGLNDISDVEVNSIGDTENLRLFDYQTVVEEIMFEEMHETNWRS